MNTKSSTILLATTLAFAACRPPAEEAQAPPSKPQPSAALLAVVDATVQAEASPIHLVRQTAQPGDRVTVSGRVMGNIAPFVAGRSAFILGDPELLTACSDRPGDACETPWDNCCDAPELKQRGTATVQVVDAEGRVLKEGIEGVGGIAKLSRLVVTGTVAEGTSQDLLVINADAIDVRP